MSVRHLLAILISVTSLSARADYGWIPEYKKLQTKFAVDVYKSASNFQSDGTTANLPSGGELQDLIVTLGADYGLAESWSLGLETPFYVSSVDGTTSRLAEGSGLGDITARLKWAVKPINPVTTLEALLKFPAGTTGGTGGALALGEGNFDFGLFVHFGQKSQSFLFSVSPGFLARFGGYSMAIAGEVAVQVMFARGYIRAFGNGIYSFEDVAPYDSSINSHDAPGAAGSFAKLNGSPVGFGIGGKIGLNITKEVTLAFSGSKALFGSKYPNYFKAGGEVIVEFDFFETPKAMKAKEVPFDFEYEKY